ncbi:MAG: hypothetical protein AAF725_04905 [Acidobacteriota bacterium]
MRMKGMWVLFLTVSCVALGIQAFGDAQEPELATQAEVPAQVETTLSETSAKTEAGALAAEDLSKLTIPVAFHFEGLRTNLICSCNPQAPDGGASGCEAGGCEETPFCPPREEWCVPLPSGSPNCGICNC